MNVATASTWLEIDLSAIRNNVKILLERAGVPLMAVVKANGYGHGIVETSQAALQGGASWLGVARLEEAQLLRAAGIYCPVLVLGYTHAERAAEAAAAAVTLTVYDPQLARDLSAQAAPLGVQIPIHAKFDTGMGRLGVFPEEGVDFIRLLRSLPGLQLTGMFTHFARADDWEHATTTTQLKRFQTLLIALKAAGLRPQIVHASNSAATLYLPEARFDLCRAGIAIYGLNPSAETPLTAGFRAALTWKARLTSVKVLPAGHGVGYNHRYFTQKDERIGVVSVGYADGLRRRLGNFALVGGIRVPMVGGVCMDQVMLNLDGVPAAKIGDEVVLIGRQGDVVITAEEVATAWGTVNYDVVCGLEARVVRFYLEN